MNVTQSFFVHNLTGQGEGPSLIGIPFPEPFVRSKEVTAGLTGKFVQKTLPENKTRYDSIQPRWYERPGLPERMKYQVKPSHVDIADLHVKERKHVVSFADMQGVSY